MEFECVACKGSIEADETRVGCAAICPHCGCKVSLRIVQSTVPELPTYEFFGHYCYQCGTFMMEVQPGQKYCERCLKARSEYSFSDFKESRLKGKSIWEYEWNSIFGVDMLEWKRIGIVMLGIIAVVIWFVTSVSKNNSSTSLDRIDKLHRKHGNGTITDSEMKELERFWEPILTNDQ
jgi:hypothetical protein